MMDKILCFALGLSPEEIEKGRTSLYGLNKEAYLLEVIPVTDAMLAMTVADALDSAPALSGSGGEKILPPGLFPYRVVVVAAQEREQVISILRAFKAVLPDPQDLIFAVITETALGWTFGEYISHLAREHESMKTRNAGK
jgi:hypothetical protein